MGFFSDIGDAIGDVFGGIVDVIDKITGGGFSKLLGNKWFKGALLAVSIVTGGIAIANGIMAAGEAGLGSAVAEFATNMSLESGGNLVNTVIDAGSKFIGGVAEGVLNPMGSDAGQALTGMYDSAVANITGTAADNASMLTEGSNAAEAANLAQGDVAGTVLDAGATPQALGGGASADGAAAAGVTQPGAAIAEPGVAASGGIDAGVGMPSTYDPVLGPELPQNSMLDAVKNAGLDPANTIAGGGFGSAAPDALATSLQTNAQPGILSQMASKAGDFASSPRGMQTIGQTLQGWAQGQAVQERWDELRKDERRRADTWTGHTGPRFGRGSRTAPTGN